MSEPNTDTEPTEKQQRREVADWLGLTMRQVHNLISDGTITLDDYDLKAIVRAYVQSVRDRSELREEQTKGHRLDNELKEEQLAKARGEVYDRESIDRDFTAYQAEVVKLHKSFVPTLKKRNPKVAQRVWDAIDERLAGIRDACKQIRISDEAKFGDGDL